MISGRLYSKSAGAARLVGTRRSVREHREGDEPRFEFAWIAGRDGKAQLTAVRATVRLDG